MRPSLPEIKGFVEKHWSRVLSIEPLVNGVENDNLKVNFVAGEAAVLRIYRSKSITQVQAEMELLRLIEGFVPCAKIIPSLRGDGMPQLSGQPTLLFDFIEGRHIERAEMTQDEFRKVGMGLRCLHASTANVDLRHYFDVSDVIYQTYCLRKKLASFPVICDFLTEGMRLAESFQFEITVQAMLHGDMDEKNLIFNKRGEVSFIDWDDATFGPTEVDIAIAVRNLCLKRMLRNPASIGVNPLDATIALCDGYGDLPGDAGFGTWLRFACFRYWLLMLTSSLMNLTYPSRNDDNYRLYQMACGYEEELNECFPARTHYTRNDTLRFDAATKFEEVMAN
jgi:hypothetical protein